ncbi:MAG TPA: rhomboid family intramembrane serine protease [Allosphingosinicella sp.]|jgi:membrane associated rhomboid family serine protease|nr:rhomboid family intramembrane serine protease [Allosphingosinicella sp.]
MRPPDSWAGARVTLALTLVTAAAWIFGVLLGFQDWAIGWGAFVPGRFGFDGAAASAAPVWLTPLTATLLHANFVHIAFNLLMLVFCGRSTENVLGPVGLTILYLIGAYVAAAAQFLVDPLSMMPMIGASGAISAVLGAYAMLFGRNKVRIANARVAVWLNALWLMAAWVGLQLIVGLVVPGLGIAIAAHIGGFLLGVALANPLLLLRYRKA